MIMTGTAVRQGARIILPKPWAEPLSSNHDVCWRKPDYRALRMLPRTAQDERMGFAGVMRGEQLSRQPVRKVVNPLSAFQS
jgi:hypothetical protein